MSAVLHTDGSYRVAPTYGGSDWAIIIDDSDGCMYLILYWKKQSTAKGTLRRARKLLRNLRIYATLTHSHLSEWAFPKYTGLKSACYLKLILKSPMPLGIKCSYQALVADSEEIRYAMTQSGQNIFPSVPVAGDL